ncbi:MAG: TonB family protein [Candidatus Omnitrophica bacterium]|nr:TonB family protein [Candidatus Omnitrophota bacterium]
MTVSAPRSLISAVVVSLVAHAAAIGGGLCLPEFLRRQQAVAAPAREFSVRAVESTALLPPIHDIGAQNQFSSPPPVLERNTGAAPSEGGMGQLSAAAEAGAGTCGLADDPAAEEMMRYQDIIKQRIQAQRRYPYALRRDRVEGSVSLQFQVAASGVVADVQVVQTSGHAGLDAAARQTVLRASPLPCFPATLSRHTTITAIVTLLYLWDGEKKAF